MPGINAILLGTLMYRSGLVPRVLPVIGLIGVPLHITAVVLTMFGVIDRVGSVALIAALPIFVWELSAGHLPGRQRFQALPHHRCNARCRHPARLPRNQRLTDTAGQGPGRLRGAEPKRLPRRTRRCPSPGRCRPAEGIGHDKGAPSGERHLGPGLPLGESPGHDQGARGVRLTAAIDSGQRTHLCATPV